VIFHCCWFWFCFCFGFGFGFGEGKLIEKILVKEGNGGMDALK
jgi:hypothetical protein